MSRRSVLAAALAVAALGVWWSLPSEQPELPPPLAEPERPAESLAPPPPPAPTSLRVRVDVTSRATFAPPSPTRVVGVRAVDGARYPTTLVAGAGAGFDAAARTAGHALAAFAHDDGRVLRQVVVGNGVEEVRFAARLVVSGRILGEDRKPVPGSTAWFGEYDAEGRRREVATDAEGAFTAEVLAGDGVPFVARAPGHAAQWRAVRVAAPPPACDAVLERAAAIDVQLAARAQALEQARVFVVPTSQVGSSLAQWPFFVQAIDDGYAVDANGRAVVDDLPQGVTVGVLVRHPLAPLGAPQPVALKGERTRAVVPMAFAEATCAGRVVDETGAPIAGAWLWLRDATDRLLPGGSQRLLPPHLGEIGASAARTAADGTFALGAGRNDGAVLMLRAPGFAGCNVPAAVVRADAPIELPAWNGGNATLRVMPPRAGTPWIVDGYAGRLDLAADRPFFAALPHEGRFDIVLTTFVGEVEQARVRHDGIAATGPIELPAPPPR